jgi:hypothetical protein
MIILRSWKLRFGASFPQGNLVFNSFGFAFPGWEDKLVARHEIEGDFTIPKIIYIYRI